MLARRSSLLASLFAAASLLAAGNALATECKTDADCGKGFTCSLSDTTVAPCPAGQKCDNPTPAPTTGTCTVAPLTCKTSADCPTYMECKQQGYGCAEPACPAGTDCPAPQPCDPPPDLASYCAPKEMKCTDDSACPAGFACSATVQVDCASPACPPGTECPQPADCTGGSYKLCAPKQVACAADADCPSTWTCMEVQTGGCASSGSGSVGSGSTGSTSGSGGTATPPSSGTGAPTPAPTDYPPQPAPDGGTAGAAGSTGTTPECTVKTEKMCIPPGYGAYTGGGLGAASPEAGGQAKDANGSSTSGGAGSAGSTSGGYYGAPANNDDGGCSVGAAGGAKSGSVGLLSLLVVGLAAKLSRRRRG